jgi:amino acid adenylation domain-containing protein
MSANSKILDEKLNEGRVYWLEKLAAPHATAGLPLDRARQSAPAQQTRETVELALNGEDVELLLRVCAGGESLIFTALLTALKVCLHRYTGEEDVIVGTAIHERYRQVSSLNRVLALRSRVRGEQTLKQLLHDVKRTLSEAYAHQKYPFEQILKHLSADRAGNHAPLFNVLLILDSINDRENVRHLHDDATLVFTRAGGGLRGVVEYNPGLFERRTVEVLGEHFRRALRAVLSAPERTIAEVELLSPEERRAQLYEFNDTRRPYPARQTIHSLFEEQAERTPDAVAVAFGERRLTYRELDERANNLACRLSKLGAAPGTLVGLYMSHSAETVVALLAVLKAGAAYVPFDPTHPAARLKFMLEDGGVKLLLTQARLRDRLPEAAATKIVCLDADWPEAEREGQSGFDGGATPEDLAYVIYTSGSTGKPKGVKIQHRALVNYVWWAKDVYLRGEALDFALYSSLAFDLTVTSVFTPLVTGNRVVVYDRDEKEPPLREILRDGEVGVLKLTPSHLALIEGEDHRRSGVRRLIVGGEAFESALARRVTESFGDDVQVFNEYGPTEATVGCMIHQFDPACDRRTAVPIGRPAANVEIYILDERLAPVPENVVGELYIAGDGLAAGYLNREDLTRERFIENPFVPGRRMYRTGDLARRLGDDRIEYLGRRDSQVKYHGYRIELNEVRCALNAHPQVRDSVVVVRAGAGGQDVLVGYYVSRKEIDAAELRAFLAESIIEETIPSLLVHLRKLPLTLNGKIDHRALPSPWEVAASVKRDYVAPQTPTETEVAAIWGAVLGQAQVGREDNFFELGGHSLLAAQVITRVRETLRVEVQLQSLFASPTVAGLAANIEAARVAGHAASSAPIERIARDGELPLSFAQQRLWFLHDLERESPAYNLHAPIRLVGRLNLAALEQALDEVVRRHEVLRSVFPTVEGRPVQSILPPRRTVPALIDLSGLPAPEAAARRLVGREMLRPFDLSTGPLLRVNFLRLREDEHVVQLTMHHIVSDGASVEVLKREVMTLYAAFSGGVASPLAELPVQHVDFAAWQRRQTHGEALQTHLAYWARQLKGAASELDSLADYPRPNKPLRRGAALPFTLPAALTGALRGLSLREGATLYMTLLAGFTALLHRYTGQDDITVGAPFANRDRAETESLVGCFINTLALRTDLSGNPTFRELLARVRAVTLDAHAHRDVPFELVVEAVRPKRRAAEASLFQVWFVMQHETPGVASQAGLNMHPLEVEEQTAQFDLTLFVSEQGRSLACGLNYSTELFKAETAAGMVEHYRRLLEEVAARPETRILDIPLQSDETRGEDDGEKPEPSSAVMDHLSVAGESVSASEPTAPVETPGPPTLAG